MKNFVAALTLRFVDRVSQPARSAASAIGSIENAQKLGLKASEKWGRGLDQLDQKLGRLASASLVTDGLGRAGEAMMRPLKGASGLATAYEVKLAEIGDTADMTTDRVNKMDRAIRAASRLGRGATQVADAAGIYVAGGLDEDVAADLLGITTKLVIGQRLAFDDAANAAMAFNQSLGVSADEMERAFDAAATAGKAGRFELKAMSQYLPTIGALGANRGLTGVSGVSELTAALTTIMDKTQDEGLTATRLRDLLLKADAPTTVNAFEKYGIDVAKGMDRAKAEGRSPLDAIMDMTESALRRGARLNQLFSEQDSQLGISALLDGRARFTKLRDEATDAVDVIETSYRRLRATNAERHMSYGAGMERLGIAVGSILAPALSVAVPLFEKVADWMSQAGENGSLLAKAAVWAVAGFAGFAVAAGAVGHAVVGVLGPLFIMKTLFGTMAPAAFMGGAAKVIGLFGRMRLAAIAFNLSMLANPVVLAVVAAVAAVALIGLVVRKYWEPIKAFFGGVGQALGEAFGPALSSIGAMLAPLKPLWDGFAGGVGKVVGWFARLLTPVKATQGQLAGATSAGQQFGRMLVVGLSLSPVGLFVRGIRSGFAIVKALMGWRPMDTLRQAWSGVTGFFGGLQARFNGYGRMIMQGLIGGVRAMLGEVAGAIVGVANSAVTRFKGVLGIKSPSRVFAALGGYTMEGLTQGLGLGGQTAVRRVAAIGAAVIGAMPSPGAGLPASARVPVPVASAGAASSAVLGGVQINSLTIQVTVQGGGAETRALGRQIGREAAEGLRRALHDEG